MKTRADALERSGYIASSVQRILRQYISITHKKRNKLFEVAERPDYSRGRNNKKDSANEPGTATFRKEYVWNEKMSLNSRVIKFHYYTSSYVKSGFHFVSYYTSHVYPHK